MKTDVLMYLINIIIRIHTLHDAFIQDLYSVC